MIHVSKEQNGLITVSLALIALVAAAAALLYTRVVMVPFVLALFIVALVAPIEDFQVKWLRLPRAIAIVVTLLVVLFIIALVFLLVMQATTTIVSTAAEYSDSFVAMAQKLVKAVEYVYPKEEPKPPPSPTSPNDIASVPGATAPPPAKPEAFVLVPLVEDDKRAAVLDVRPQAKLPAKDANEALAPATPADPNVPPKVPEELDWRSLAQVIIKDLKTYILNIATNAFGTIFGLISGVLFVIVFVLFMLLGRNPYTVHSQVYADVVQKIRRYVGIKLAISAVTGVLVWATLNVLGLKLASVFGILAFLLNFIPSIGSIIATLLPIPIAVVQFQSSPERMVLVVAIPTIIQNLLGNIIEPKLQGEGLNLHPVTILLALSFWGLLWGIAGMFLAAPITAAIRIVLMQFDTLRPIANLLAGDFTSAGNVSEKRTA